MKVTDLLKGKSSGELLSDAPRGVYLVSFSADGSCPWLVLWDPSGGPGCMCMDVEDGTVCDALASDNYVIRRITEISFK